MRRQQTAGRNRWPSRLAALLAMSIVLFSIPVRAQQRQEPAAPRPAGQGSDVYDLLAQLHDPNPQTVQWAQAQLAGMGMSPQQMQFGAKLAHPDPRVRLALIDELKNADPHSQVEFLHELTFDNDQKVRAATLEAIRSAPPHAKLSLRVGTMAENDPNAVVQGYARLLHTELSSRTRGGTASGFAPQPTPRPAAAAPLFAPVSAINGGAAVAPKVRPSSQPGPRPWEIPTAQMQAGANLPQFDSQVIPIPNVAQPGSVEPVAFADLPDTAPALEDAPFSQSFGTATPDMRTAAPAASAGFASFQTDLNAPPPRSNPGILDRPLDPLPDEPALTSVVEPLVIPAFEPPLGFSGKSSVLPTEEQENSHFVPVEDRWRMGFPAWDRYGKGHPYVDDYPYVEGHWWDPFNQNVLKGDYPIAGQHTFLNITVTEQMLNEWRRVPTSTTPFESTVDPFQEEFFGDSEQYFFNNNLKMSFQLFHGSAAFKPIDWQVKLTPVFNINYLNVDELGIVNPDVRKGTDRYRDDHVLEEWFAEAKIADLGPDYDFASIRAGSQLFTSDFRGFIFSDVNRAIRLFGTRFGNRDQFNIIYFDQFDKDTNSNLNTYRDRHQNTFIANYYRQDFIFPGYTGQLSFHYNHDRPSFKFDDNEFLVRPDPVGVFSPHEVKAYYLGVAGDGHIGRINITNAFYYVFGQDSLNPLANDQQDISGYFAAVELSYDRDWMRFRTSFLWASGDDDVLDDRARGFDSIFDNPNFAGGEFSYWQRQAVRLFGVNLVQRQSLIPDLRSSKTQGQSNFVNPGLNLFNVGADFDITPKMKLITNVNFLWFDETEPLERFLFQDNIAPRIGTDVSFGIEYRPLLNDNVMIIAGMAGLFPGEGFRDLYDALDQDATNLYSNFVELVLTY